MSGGHRIAALRIVAAYALVAALWLSLSDVVVGMLPLKAATHVLLDLLKGVLLILVTGALLYQLIARSLRVAGQMEEALRQKTRQLEELTHHLEARVEEEIARRRRHEQTLIQQAKLAAMGEMLGAIAHQWRQPLNTLALCVQNIHDSLLHAPPDRAYLERTVDKSMEQIRHMSNTIDAFRSFFQPGRERVVFDAATAVGEALALFAGPLAAQGIVCRVLCSSGDGAVHEIEIADLASCPEHPVEGYRNEFEQVLLNLIGNARDAILERRDRSPGEDAGQGALLFALGAAEEKISLKVCDNGGGIRPDALERIFEPYFTTKGPSKGTGIGLYLSRIIIEDHMQGRLIAENTGAGACFTIELPAAGAAQPGGRTAA